jgi:hypothetical protein
MTTRIDLVGGCMPLYSSKSFEKLTLKQRRNNIIAEIPFLVREKA